MYTTHTIVRVDDYDCQNETPVMHVLMLAVCYRAGQQLGGKYHYLLANNSVGPTSFVYVVSFQSDLEILRWYLVFIFLQF